MLNQQRQRPQTILFVMEAYWIKFHQEFNLIYSTPVANILSPLHDIMRRFRSNSLLPTSEIRAVIVHQ